MLKLPIVIMSLSISSFSAKKCYFTYFKDMLLSTHKIRIIISSQYIILFDSRLCFEEICIRTGLINIGSAQL